MRNVKYWLQGKSRQNFGDHLTEFLGNELFYDIRPDERPVRIIGSSIHDWFAAVNTDGVGNDTPASGTIFWGCGIRELGGLSIAAQENVEILSVRGPVSAADLRLGDEVPQGDPGLMVPALYTPVAIDKFKGRSICVPHYHDLRTDREVRELTGADLVLRAKIAPGSASLRDFIDALTTADFVLTGSLHAAIVACAYGRPFAFWDSGAIDLPLKWEDFAQSVGFGATFATTVESGHQIWSNEIRDRLHIPSMLPLLAATPFPLKATGLAKILAYELARAPEAARAELLNDFIARLGRRENDLDELVEKSIALLAEYRRTVGTEAADRQEREAANAEVMSARMALEAEVGRLRGEIHVRSAQADVLEDQRKAAGDRAAELAELLARERAEHGELARKHAGLVSDHAELTAGHAALVSDHAGVVAGHAALVADNGAIGDRYAKAAQELDRLQIENDALRESLEERRAAVARAHDEAARAAKDAAAAEDAHIRLRHDLLEQAAALTASLDAARGDAAARSGVVTDLSNQIEDLTAAQRAAEDEKAAVRRLAETAVAERDRLSEQVAVLDAALDTERRRHEVLEARIAALDERTTDANQVHTQAEARLAAAQEARARIAHDRDRMIAHQRNERDAARHLIEQEKQKSRALARHMQATNSALRTALRERELAAQVRDPIDFARLEEESSGLARLYRRIGGLIGMRRRAKPEAGPAMASNAAAAATIAASGLFDAEWIRQQIGSGDQRTPAELLRHYVEDGWRSGLSPHPLFDTTFYLARHPEVRDSGAEPFSLYLESGWKQHHVPHPLFDRDFYLASLEGDDADGDPLIHYANHGWLQGRSPHPFFDPEFYLDHDPELLAAGVDPLSHYLATGWRERRSPHALIDIAAYLERNEDLRRSGIEPLGHYVAVGQSEGRRLSWLIDPEFYGSAHGDLLPRDADPVYHYLTEGWQLGLQPNALFFPDYYCGQSPEIDCSVGDPLQHFVLAGWHQDRRPNPLFVPLFYSEGIALADSDPLTHYLAGGWRDLRPTHPVIQPRHQLERDREFVECGREPLAGYLAGGWAYGEKITPLFDPVFYARMREDLLPAQVDPLIDYLEHGWRAGIAPHPLFDSRYYRALHMRDDADEAVDPLSHFVAVSARHQVSPHPLFDPDFYRANSPDVAAGGGNAFLHYVEHGGREGRSPNPVFHASGYIFDHRDVAEFGGNPLIHYLERGRAAGASPHPLFDPAYYARRYPDVAQSGIDPYEHFVRYGSAEGRQCSEVLIPQRAPSHAMINLPAVDDPDVVVIIPVYRSFADTFRCLYSISESPAEIAKARIVLADDCPTHPVAPFFSNIANLDIISQSENQGFLRNCNTAAAQTGGSFIVFLNNDTVVRPGWLDAMMALARRDERVGLVGCKLLNADGSIQEAGGVMFQDGWGFPYGRNDNPDRPQYNFVREVACVIGACFLVRRSIFEEVGGFDDLYYPAFFEEFDLAFAMADRGYKVMYQPASEVFHVGSASYGADVRDRQSGINQARFKEKWAARLAAGHADEGALFLARDRHYRSGIILVIDDSVPEYDKHAGALTMYQYLKLLTELDFKVIYVPQNGVRSQPYTSVYQQMGIEVLYGDVSISGWLAAHGRHIDYAWIARPDTARHYIEDIRRHTQARLLYYTHDLHFLREERRYDIDGDAWALSESIRLRPIEIGIFKAVDCVTTPSRDEAAVIAGLAPGAEIKVLTPYFYSHAAAPAAQGSLPLRDRREIIFVGGYGHTPNVDAAVLLVREIMPRVWNAIPDARVMLVGSRPPAEVLALAGPKVEVIGFVEDLAPYYARARMSVSPLRYGAGVKGKIVGSLEAGVPVVTTTIGNEGIALGPGSEALIGDEPGELAHHIMRLFEDPDLLDALADAGRQVITHRFTEEGARDGLLAALDLRLCNICGMREHPVAHDYNVSSSNWREDVACHACWSLNRMAKVADVLLKPFRHLKIASIDEALPLLARLRIHEFGFVGPIHDRLRTLPGFSSSDFFDDVPRGERAPNGVMCQDLQALTFGDAEVDLCISQDVFEHIPDPWAAFREIHRVLKVGGRHVFSVPFSRLGEVSLMRARLAETGIEHLLPAEYHGDPIREAGALVFTDFGRDMIGRLGAIGFDVAVHETFHEAEGGGYVAVFATTKRAPGGGQDDVV